jgi:hypothetical protein
MLMEDHIDEALEDEELESPDEESEDDEPATPTPAAEPEEGAGVESSLEELLAKREGRPAEEEEEDDSMLTIGREERLEPLATKVIPPTDKEFVCKNCHLVKHRSQLKDRARMLCRDCA